MFFDLPGSDSGDLSRDMDGISNMRAGLPGGMDPTQMSPQELHATIWKILSWRDSIMKRIEVSLDGSPCDICLTGDRMVLIGFLD